MFNNKNNLSLLNFSSNMSSNSNNFKQNKSVPINQLNKNKIFGNFP